VSPRARILALALFAGCTPRPSAGEPASAPPAPNVVVILVDDLGVEVLGCTGGESYATPRIDALAASGVRFTQAYTTPLCTPTRVRLMTGRGGLRSYVAFSILDRRERTFAHQLQDAGYVTGVAGKWQLYGAEHYGEFAGTGTRPEDAGFDTWCLWQVEQLGSRYADPLLEVDGELREHPGGYGPAVVSDWACDFVRAHQDERFLLYLPLMLTHDPFQPTPLSGPERGSREERFADMVAYLDLVVGRLVDALEDAGLRERTLVVFATDNGTSGKITSRRRGADQRGGKGRVKDAGTHVPLVVSWPGRVPAGASCDALVDLMDVMPTVVEAAGARLPEDRVIDGRSLLPLARGEDAPRREALAFWYLPRPRKPGTTETRWAHGERYKLYGDGRLYDLTSDPEEQHPIAPEADDPDARAARQRLAVALAGLPAEPAKLARPATEDGGG
jgi:arylsulfatase A